jgi:hypothetical protein
MPRALPRALAIEKRQKYYRLHWSCHNRSGLGGDPPISLKQVRQPFHKVIGPTIMLPNHRML